MYDVLIDNEFSAACSGTNPASNANIAIYLDDSNTLTKLGLASSNPVSIDGQRLVHAARPGHAGRHPRLQDRVRRGHAERLGRLRPGPGGLLLLGREQRLQLGLRQQLPAAHGLPAGHRHRLRALEGRLQPGQSGHLDQPDHVQREPESQPERDGDRPPRPRRRRTAAPRPRRQRRRTAARRPRRTAAPRVPAPPAADLGSMNEGPRRFAGALGYPGGAPWTGYITAWHGLIQGAGPATVPEDERLPV